MNIIEKIKKYSWDKKVKKIQSSIPYHEAMWLEELCKKTGEKEATVIAYIVSEAYKADTFITSYEKEIKYHYPHLAEDLGQ